MIIGHRWWILIWYGILLIGVVGLLAAIYWGRRSRWTNLDEVFRACGTVLVSVGMLIFLYEVAGPAWQVFLVVALVLFVLAFIIGRRAQARRPRKPRDDEDDEDDEDEGSGRA